MIHGSSSSNVFFPSIQIQHPCVVVGKFRLMERRYNRSTVNTILNQYENADVQLIHVSIYTNALILLLRPYSSKSTLKYVHISITANIHKLSEAIRKYFFLFAENAITVHFDSNSLFTVFALKTFILLARMFSRCVCSNIRFGYVLLYAFQPFTVGH